VCVSNCVCVCVCVRACCMRACALMRLVVTSSRVHSSLRKKLQAWTWNELHTHLLLYNVWEGHSVKTAALSPAAATAPPATHTHTHTLPHFLITHTTLLRSRGVGRPHRLHGCSTGLHHTRPTTPRCTITHPPSLSAPHPALLLCRMSREKAAWAQRRPASAATATPPAARAWWWRAPPTRHSRCAHVRVWLHPHASLLQLGGQRHRLHATAGAGSHNTEVLVAPGCYAGEHIQCHQSRFLCHSSRPISIAESFHPCSSWRRRSKRR